MKHQPDIIWSLKIGHLRIIFIVNNDKTLFYSRKQNKSLILSFLDDRIKKQLGFLCLIFFSQIISFSLRYKLPPLCGMDRWRNWYRFFLFIWFEVFCLRFFCTTIWLTIRICRDLQCMHWEKWSNQFSLSVCAKNVLLLLFLWVLQPNTQWLLQSIWLFQCIILAMNLIFHPVYPVILLLMS